MDDVRLPEFEVYDGEGARTHGRRSAQSGRVEFITRGDRRPNLPFPHSSGISGSRHGHMRELRIQVGGRPLRVFYAFDPRRAAILLIGGDKTGQDDF